MSRSVAFVIAKKRTNTSPVMFRAVRMYEGQIHILAFDVYDSVEEFTSFEEADSLVQMYNDGPDYDVVRARWCSTVPRGWEDLDELYD